jgi:hypothetical protein
MDCCPVCDGSGSLLNDTCPLCDKSEQNQEAMPPHLPVLARSNLCLVLDIDGTMLSESICSAKFMRSMLRPHLDEFLDFAFAAFSGVAIWTAGSREWLDAFIEAVDPAGRRPWAFTWSAERISWVREVVADGSEPVHAHIKRLSKIWQKKALRAKGFTAHTTLIVDNNPAVCCENYGNAIYIKTYGADDESNAEDSSKGGDDYDDWLLVLIRYLKLLTESQTPGTTVRHIDKRNWYVESKRENFSRPFLHEHFSTVSRRPRRAHSA